MTRSFITIILLVAASLLSIFYIRSQWTQFSLLRTEVEKLNTISAELDEIIAKRDSLLSAVNTISKSDLDRLDQALPMGPRAADFLVTLEQVVLHHNLSIKRIDVSSLSNTVSPVGAQSASGSPMPGAIALAPKPQAKIAEFPITLTVTGSYESFKNFLRETESLLRITTMSDITFTAGEKSNTFDFTVRGKTYYQ
ncbi:MAG: type 4a pilus biogenesis protein PilO [Candidatus Sungbacteria bacterium]|nr:type 4a pilus biogenesis protein PilO [Candidatus Sungbacteria bacterium]